MDLLKITHNRGYLVYSLVAATTCGGPFSLCLVTPKGSISPGQIPKPTVKPEMVDRMRLRQPIRRTGQVQDLKGAVALLASPAGDWITGLNLLVDGGWSVF